MECGLSIIISHGKFLHFPQKFNFFHTITGEAIYRGVFFLTTTATAFYVCRTSPAVKAAFAEYFFIHNVIQNLLRSTLSFVSCTVDS